jgi:serine phosphatase RsbU (regulator of sigma subunit)/HAMP domain-containing protein
MSRPFALPPAPKPEGPGLRDRLSAFLLRRKVGWLLLGALAVHLVDLALPVPVPLAVVATVVLWVFAVWGAFRLTRYVLGRLLWRIRSKLIVSYLFIALVPVLLLTVLFFIATVLASILVAAHLVGEQMAEVGRELRAASVTALADLPSEDRAAAAAMEARLRGLRERHPALKAAFLRKGRAILREGRTPNALPDWWKGPHFEGLAGLGEGPDVFRTVSVVGESALVLDLPLDRSLFAPLEERSGIHVLSREELPGDARARRGERPPLVEVDEGPRAGFEVQVDPSDEEAGLHGVSLPERLDWTTGKRETRPLPFRFSPSDLARRLSPGVIDDEAQKRNLADILVLALAVVGGAFLVMYAGALGIGLLLARSITRSVHALHLGTERLRAGDFAARIPVTSRDQLGELADSFNHMAGGIEGLLGERAEKDRLEEELRIARQIQMSLLPAEDGVTVAGLRISALCLPAAEVGGDYYDLLPLSETRLGVVVADVSGKGTSAALYMAELKGLVLSLSRIYDSPARLLGEANRILAENLDSRSFITMSYAVVDVAAGVMRFARAGHSPLLHFEARTGRTRLLAPPGLGLGLDRGERFDQILQEQAIPLEKGDVYLLFTDGLSEAMNPQAELFGEGRLAHILNDSEGLTTEEIRERILREVRAFAGEATQADDMTLVLLKVG